MNQIEQNYADYILPLTPIEAAASWDNVQSTPLVIQETDFANWLNVAPDPIEAIYRVFEFIYDSIPEPEHINYVNAFVNYSLDGMCQRKKAPRPH